MKQLIQKLVETTGPSGSEKMLRELVRAEVSGLADEVRVDAMGNLIARKGQKAEGGLRVMLSAHMDEIGVIVTHIDPSGFLRFTNIGGVRRPPLLGSRVLFTNGTRGVIGAEAYQGRDKMVGIEQMFIDVGATAKDDCPVRVGDVACFDRAFEDLGDRLMSKAMDDRVSVAVEIEVMRQLASSPHEVYYVFSTQEEVGLRGARAAAFSVDPDLGISIDVTPSGDTPKNAKMPVGLGKGPAIKVRDGGMVSDPRVIEAMVQAVERAKLPYQMEVLEAGSTDATAMITSRAGVPAGCVSIPTRYVHTPSEMVDYNDVQNSVRLLVELLSKPIEL